MPNAPSLLGRRQILRIMPAAAAGTATAVASAALTGGCAALAGEETIDAFVIVKGGGDGRFAGWTEYNLDEPADPDQGATLERVLLRAPEGVTDLRFITSLLAEVVSGDVRTPVATGGDFPAADNIAKLDVIYDGDLRPLFSADAQKIRIEWSGTIDTTFVFPEDGIRVDASIILEIL